MRNSKAMLECCLLIVVSVLPSAIPDTLPLELSMCTEMNLSLKFKCMTKGLGLIPDPRTTKVNNRQIPDPIITKVNNRQIERL